MTTSPIWGHAPAERTKTKFGIRGRMADVIICFKFYRNRLRGFRAVRGQKWGFPIDFDSRPYNRSGLWLRVNCSVTTSRLLLQIIIWRVRSWHTGRRLAATVDETVGGWAPGGGSHSRHHYQLISQTRSYIVSNNETEQRSSAHKTRIYTAAVRTLTSIISIQHL